MIIFYGTSLTKRTKAPGIFLPNRNLTSFDELQKILHVTTNTSTTKIDN